MDVLINSQQAIDAICEAFSYAYCDNCEKEMDEDLCGDCHRKYQNWSISRKTVEKIINALPSAQSEDWMEQNKDRILKAGMEGREVEFRIGGRLFAIREKAQ